MCILNWLSNHEDSLNLVKSASRSSDIRFGSDPDFCDRQTKRGGGIETNREGGNWENIAWDSLSWAPQHRGGWRLGANLAAAVIQEQWGRDSIHPLTQ